MFKAIAAFAATTAGMIIFSLLDIYFGLYIIDLLYSNFPGKAFGVSILSVFVIGRLSPLSIFVDSVVGIAWVVFVLSKIFG